jgi:hypothetical protein
MRGNVDHFELGADGLSVTALLGWALDPEAPDTPVEVLAAVNGVPWGTGTASGFRQDLVAVGRGGALAFRIQLRMPLALSAGLLDGEGLRVVAASGADRPAQWLPFNEQYCIEPLRRIRDAASPATGTVAVFTMVYNEPRNLPLWSRYYGAQVGPENCWVLDHGSSDGSTDGLACHRVRLPRDPMDSLLRAQRCSAFQHFLLRFYDTVIYVDSDEFLVADPRHHSSLAAWAAQRRNRNVRAFGLDLVQDVGVEPPIDSAQPILAQRRCWMFSRFMCKPAVAGDPMNWQPGFHELEPGSAPVPLDPDLRLVHLRLLDLEWCLAKQAQYRALEWSARQLQQGWAAYQREGDEAIRNTFLGVLQRRAPDDIGPDFLRAQPIEDIGPVMRVPDRFQHCL